jgi:tetratricopeptide (TPR) repeat protein
LEKGAAASAAYSKPSQGFSNPAPVRQAIDLSPDQEELLDDYLCGRYFLTLQTKAGLHKALEYFNTVTRLDPGSALGYCWLADAHLSRGMSELVSPKEAWELSRSATAKALEIDSNLADVHLPHGLANLYLHYNWQMATESLDRAMKLNPGFPYVYFWKSFLLGARGDIQGSVEMAKRAGFSLVMEDWDYHKQGPGTPPQEWLRKGVQLDQLRQSPYSIRSNGKDKLIVATLRSGWLDKHEALAPASVIDPLTEKIKKAPIDLEDLLPVVLFTNAQWREWIQTSKDLSIIMRHLYTVGDPLWQFYAMLTPKDRAQAATPEGLTMDRFSPEVVSELLAGFGKFRDKRLVYSTYKPNMPSIPDEQGLAQMVLRLKANEVQYYSTSSGAAIRIPQGGTLFSGQKVVSYVLYLSGSGDNANTQYADSAGPSQMPFYSKEREAEMLKPVKSETNPPADGTINITVKSDIKPKRM